jgi:hypothetical protein
VVGQVPGAGERALQEHAGDDFDGGAPAGFGAIGAWNRTSAGQLHAGGLPARHHAVAIGSPVRVTVATPRTVIVPQSGADGVERGGSGTGSVEASDDGDWSGLGPAARRCGGFASSACRSPGRAANRGKRNAVAGSASRGFPR